MPLNLVRRVNLNSLCSSEKYFLVKDFKIKQFTLGSQFRRIKQGESLQVFIILLKCWVLLLENGGTVWNQSLFVCVRTLAVQGANGFKQKEGRFRLVMRKTFFYSEGGETLAWIAQRGGRCPIPGNIPGQAGRGSEQPDPVEDVPARCRGWAGWPRRGPSHPNHAMIL